METNIPVSTISKVSDVSSKSRGSYKKNPDTEQKKIFDTLLLEMCYGPSAGLLFRLRSCAASKLLNRENYGKFILLIDRLLETA